MSAGLYLLIRFDDKNRLVPAVQALNTIDGVAKWDAVDGHYDLVLKLRPDDADAIERVRALEGVSAIDRCELETDNDTDASGNPEKVHSYVFMETEEARRDTVMTGLAGMDEIAFVSPLDGDFDLVALVEGIDLAQVDRVVGERLASVDGVLRVKQERILHLDRL